MKYLPIKFFTFLMILVFMFTSCRDDDQSEITCSGGLELVNESCQCPEGKLQVGEDCRELNENEYWATMPDSYPCRDTFLIEFGAIDSVEEYMKVDLIILNAEAHDGLMPVSYTSRRFYFKENTSRKEFYTKGGDGDPFCEVNGMKTGTKWEGKIIDDTEIQVKMYHRNIINEYEIIDSTELVFTKEIL